MMNTGDSKCGKVTADQTGAGKEQYKVVLERF